MKMTAKVLTSFFSFQLLLMPGAWGLVITEVFTQPPSSPNNSGIYDANCAGKTQLSSNQYVEIYNETNSNIDLAGHTLSDGTSSVTIVAWNNNFNGPLDGIAVANDNSTILPARSHAIIFDPDYAKCDQLLNASLPKTIYAFTLQTIAVPGTRNFGSGGISETESVTIRNASNTVVATFGSSFTPSAAGESVSWEMINPDLANADVSSNWQRSNVHGARSMGFANSVTTPRLVITEVYAQTPSGSNTGINNALCTGTIASSDQFVEVYNDSPIPLDLSGFLVGDGTSDDTLVAWRPSFHGTLSSSATLMNPGSAVLPPFTHGLILDPDYGQCDQSFSSLLSGGIYVFSLATSASVPGSQSFGSGGIATTEAVTLKGPSGNELSTYGSPLLAALLPFAPGAGNSAERKSVSSTDTPGQWQNSRDYLGLSPGRANSIGENDIVITEIMSTLPAQKNICCENELSLNRAQTQEYVEIYNRGSTPVDLSQFSITEGAGLDYLRAWNTSHHGALRNSGVVTNSTILQPGRYALILDPDYANFGDQVYDIPPDALILTVGTSTGSQGIGAGGISATEPLTLYDGAGVTVTTYGSPVASNRASFSSAVDDGLDAIPVSSGVSRSVERIDLFGDDVAGNWQVSTDFGIHSPGGPNSVTAGVPKLAWLGFGSPTTVVQSDVVQSESRVVAAFTLSSPETVHTLGLASNDDLDTFSGSFSLQLYRDGAGENNSLSDDAVLVGTLQRCPALPLVRDALSGTNVVKFGVRDWIPLIEGRQVSLESTGAAPSARFTTGGSMTLSQGELKLTAELPSDLRSAESATVRCRDGAWILENQNLTNGNYKLLLTLTSAPTHSTTLNFMSPIGWTRDQGNRSNTTPQISPHSIILSP
jgi:hypothetical protein